MAASPDRVAVPHENTDVPLRTRHGVLGIIRMTRVFRGNILDHNKIGLQRDSYVTR